jgi:serine/threonine-protein kinase
MILQQPPPPLRNTRPDAPEALQNVLTRALEKDPKRRYLNMAEFAAALLPFATRSGRTSVERISRVINAGGLSAAQLTQASSADSTRPASATQAAWGQGTLPGKRRAPWVVLGVAVVALAGGAFALLGNGHAPSTPAAEALPSTTPSAVAAALPALPAVKVEPPAAPVVAPVEAPPTVAPTAKANIASVAPRPTAKAALVAKPKKGAEPAHTAASPEPSPVAPKRSAADLYSDRK